LTGHHTMASQQQRSFWVRRVAAYNQLEAMVRNLTLDQMLVS